jgi:protein O-GlcNAc transferase
VFYELALHFNPRCAEACNNLGVIYKDRDNLDKAVECYQVRFAFSPIKFVKLQHLHISGMNSYLLICRWLYLLSLISHNL